MSRKPLPAPKDLPPPVGHMTITRGFDEKTKVPVYSEEQMRALAVEVERRIGAALGEPVAWQHREPVVNNSGNTVGHSDWQLGRGLDWWPNRALYAAPQPPAVPAGWQMVPVEPMREICRAMADVADPGGWDNSTAEDQNELFDIFRSWWPAMLAAAPKAPTAAARVPQPAERHVSWEDRQLAGMYAMTEGLKPAGPQPTTVPAAAQPADPVAVVGPSYQLLWASGEPLTDIVKRTGVTVGSVLYTASQLRGAVQAERETCQRICREMSYEFRISSPERAVLQRVATRIDMAGHGVQSSGQQGRQRMTACKSCGSFAINHQAHGRDGSAPDLCDVCFWRARAERLVYSVPRWYVVDAAGQPTLCRDAEDAEAYRQRAALEWPLHGPYRAVRMVEVSA